MAASKGNLFTQKFKEVSIITAIAIVAASLIFYFNLFNFDIGIGDKPDIPKYLILESNYKQSYSNQARLPDDPNVRFESKIINQSTFFSTSKSVEEVVAWYRQQLLSNDWEIKDESSFTMNSNAPEARTSGIQIFALNQDQTYRLNIFILPGASGPNQAGTLVTLGYRPYAVPQ